MVSVDRTSLTYAARIRHHILQGNKDIQVAVVYDELLDARLLDAVPDMRQFRAALA